MTTTTPETETEKTVESPAEQENESFGTWLRRQRELREISLREIADTSKISLRYLQALEDDRFDILPAAVFAKGFLRQYARYVGLDPEEAVNFYLTANGLSQDDDHVDQAAQRSSGSTPWSYAMIVFAIAVVLMAVISTLIWFNRRGDILPGGTAPDTTVPDTVLPDTVLPENALPDAVPADASGGSRLEVSGPEATAMPLTAESLTGGPNPASVTETPSAGFFVTLDFRGDCWVRATVDDETREDRVYTQGESLSLEALQLVDLELGNTFEVDVEVNGRPMSLTNESNSPVRRVSIDLETAAALAQGGD